MGIYPDDVPPPTLAPLVLFLRRAKLGEARARPTAPGAAPPATLSSSPRAAESTRDWMEAERIFSESAAAFLSIRLVRLEDLRRVVAAEGVDILVDFTMLLTASRLAPSP